MAFRSFQKFTISACRSSPDMLELSYVLKPRYYRPTQEHLVKVISAWEHASVDFKGPIVTSPRGTRFLFVVVDDYSRFPFAFACKDTSASSVVNCLSTLFSLSGFPSYVHSDRGTAFLSLICTAGESPLAILLLFTVLGTLNVNVSIKRFGKQYHL